MELFIQLTLTGLTNGAILSLAALGFVLIYKSSDVINFAQGEFLLVGARAVQVGTANFVNPRATLDIIEGLEEFMLQHNIENISDITGTLKTG